MYRNQKKKFCEDPSTLRYPIFMCKKSRWPLRAKKIVFKMGFIVFTIKMYQSLCADISYKISRTKPSNLSTFLAISQPHKLGSIYRLLHLKRVA